MLYIPKFVEYLEFLTDEEVKDYVVKKISKYFKSKRKELYSKLEKEKSLIKVAKSFYSFLAAPADVDNFLDQLKIFTTLTTLVLECKTWMIMKQDIKSFIQILN